MIHMYHINVVRSSDLWTFCRTWKGASAPSTSASTSASRRPERPGRSVSNLETPKDGVCKWGMCRCCEWFAPQKSLQFVKCTKWQYVSWTLQLNFFQLKKHDPFGSRRLYAQLDCRYPVQLAKEPWTPSLSMDQARVRNEIFEER